MIFENVDSAYRFILRQLVDDRPVDGIVSWPYLDIRLENIEKIDVPRSKLETFHINVEPFGYSLYDNYEKIFIVNGELEKHCGAIISFSPYRWSEFVETTDAFIETIRNVIGLLGYDYVDILIQSSIVYDDVSNIDKLREELKIREKANTK